jgi:hypothetical protein
MGIFLTELWPPFNIQCLFPFSLTSLLYCVTAAPLHASKHPAKWLNEDWHHWFFTEIHILEFGMLSNIIIRLKFRMPLGLENNDNVVDIANGYGLEDRGIRVRVPTGSRIFSMSGVHLLSNGYRNLFPWG